MTYIVKRRPLEFIGQDTESTAKETPKDWEQGSGDIILDCPYDGRECYKITKTPPPKIIGCCVAGLPKQGSRGTFEPVIICPKRFYQGNIVFNDIKNLIFLKANYAKDIHKIKIFSELGTPAPHNRKIDKTYVAYNKKNEMLGYIAVEIQATATGSTGPIVEARNDYFDPLKTFKDSYKYGTNKTMSSKTILEQILHKVPVFSTWGIKTLLVIQNTFMRHLQSQYSFSEFKEMKPDHDFIIFSYALKKELYGYNIVFEKAYGVYKKVAMKCILPNKKILDKLKTRQTEFTKKFSDHPSLEFII